MRRFNPRFNKRSLLFATAAIAVTAQFGVGRELERELERLYGKKPTTQIVQEAEREIAKQELADKLSDEAWQRVQPEIAAWAEKGKPYLPAAAKPEELPQASIPAFPGAWGGGMYSFGGRDGKVIVVTSLADSGPGTLREACEMAGPRIVVFNVAGIIKLERRIRVRAPYITIAGQTAPGDGVCIAGNTVELETHDVILRHLRFRRGETSIYDRNDSLGGNPVGNIMIDHVSASWGLDENMSMYRHVYHSPDGKDIKMPTVNLTIQNSISSEGLDTYHHAFGSTIGGLNSAFHHNLYACNTGRNPSIGMTGDFSWVNNVVFNWRHRTTDGAGRNNTVNIVNNYYKPGPITALGQPISYRLIKVEGAARATTQPTHNFYVAGNVVEGNAKVTADNWAGGVQGVDSDDAGKDKAADAAATAALPAVKAESVLKMPPLPVQDAQSAYEFVLANAGATLPKRDAVDARVVEIVRTGKPTYEKGIITDIKQVGGYPTYAGESYTDSDHDGMPDAWETAHGLNPNDPADAIADSNGDGYSNIEKYINGIDPSRKVDWKDLKNNVDTLAVK